MKYRSIGETAQVIIKNVQDLISLKDLDDTHWVATSAPLDAFHLNIDFLKYIDTGNDGRISSDEVKQSLRWFFDIYVEPSKLKMGVDILDPIELNSESSSYKSINEVYEYIKSHCDDDKVLLNHVVKLKNEIQAIIIQQSPIVKLETISDDGLKEYFRDIIAIHGGCEHPGGGQGVSVVSVNEFQDIIAKWTEWQAVSNLSDDEHKTEVFPFAKSTPAIYGIFKSVNDKIEQYFSLCDLVKLDPELKKSCWPRINDDSFVDLKDLNQVKEILGESPIAEPNANKRLLFEEFVNPAYVEAIKKFYKDIFVELYGQEEVMEYSQWLKIKSVFVPYESWVAAKPKIDMSKFPKEKLLSYLQTDISSKALEYIESIPQPTVSFDQITVAEKAMLFRKLFMAFANNYVAMSDLYDYKKPSILEEGTLIMDGRRFNLAIRVFDQKEHMVVTKNSSTYVMYVELTNEPLNKKIEVAVPLARGMSGYIMIGKRGIFEHVDGTSMQAKVVQIVDFPVSFVDAIIKPFKKLGATLTNKIDSIAINAEKKLASTTDSMIDPDQKVSPPPAANSNQTAGMIAGGGFAIAAIGSSLAFMTKTLSEIHPGKIVMFIVCLILAMLIPLSIVAFIRLARRDISCLLEGAGWAINPRLRITKRMKKYISEKTVKTIIFGICFTPRKTK
jgi:hypothetical protein